MSFVFAKLILFYDIASQRADKLASARINALEFCFLNYAA